MNDDEKKPLARGAKRMRELAPAYEAARLKLEDDILTELAREPGALDRIAAEALSSAVISARRKRAAGRFDTEQLKLVTQLLRATGLKPPPADARAPETLEDYLSRTAEADDGGAEGEATP